MDSPCLANLSMRYRAFRSIGEELFMQAFETASMPFEEWTHEAHLRMAWNYLTTHGLAKGTPLIKEGIIKFNEKNKERITHGYSETVTMFYIHVINKCVLSMPAGHTFEDFILCNQHLTDVSYLGNFYSKSLLESAKSKEVFIEPDKHPLP